MASYRVEVSLYSLARVEAGRSAVFVEVPPDGLPAADLVQILGRRFPRMRPVLRTCRFFCNDRPLVHLRRRVRPGDRFSVHPPYGGG